jgi:hypothetical protein
LRKALHRIRHAGDRALGSDFTGDRRESEDGSGGITRNPSDPMDAPESIIVKIISS